MKVDSIDSLSHDGTAEGRTGDPKIGRRAGGHLTTPILIGILLFRSLAILMMAKGKAPS